MSTGVPSPDSYTEEQKKEFRRRFAAKRRRQLLLIAPLLLLVVAVTLAQFEPAWLTPYFPYLLSFGAMFLPLGVFFTLRNWRCPACGEYLGRDFNPNVCPRCGIRLQ